MIRPFTAICMAAAFASGLFLYQSKHQAQMLDRQIMGVLKQTETARERIGVMKAEWALLNEPERLAELSQKHLGLRTLSPTQFVAVADLGSRLPPPIAPGTALPVTDEAAAVVPAPVAATPVVPAPVVPVAAAPAAPAARLAARVPPAVPVPPPAPAQPVQVASAAARPHAPQPEHRAEPAVAHSAPGVQMAALPVPAAPAMQPVHHPLAPVVSIAAAPIQPRPSAPSSSTPSRSTAASPARDGDLRPVTAVLASSPPVSAYQPATAYQSAPLYQSALGGARPSLPPPVPYGAVQAR